LDGTAMAKKLMDRSAVAGQEWHDNTLASVDLAIDSAIASAEKHKQATQAALNAGSYAAGLRKVDRAEMTSTIAATSPSAVSDGLQRRAGKVARKFVKLAAAITTVRDGVLATPNVTVADRETRMLKNSRDMAKIRGTI